MRNIKDVYQCSHCLRKFPVFSHYQNHRKFINPQSKYLKPMRNMQLNGEFIYQIPKICFKCDKKLIYKLKTVMNKKREAIGDLQTITSQVKNFTEEWWKYPFEKRDKKNPEHQKQFQKDLFEFKYGPEVDRHPYSKKKKRYVCSLCDSIYIEQRHNYRWVVRLQFAMQPVVTVNHVCEICKREIYEEILFYMVKNY